MNDILAFQKDMEYRILFDESLDLPARIGSCERSGAPSYNIYTTELKIPFKGLSAGSSVILKELSPNQELIYRKLTGIQNPYLEKILWVDTNDHGCLSVNEFINRPECPFLDYRSAGIESRSLSLEQYVKHFGVLNETEALIFAYDICEGLGAIRGAKLVHSDLAPQNILLTDSQKIGSAFEKIPGIHQYVAPKIIDFDITADEKKQIHDVTAVIGTKPYAAPDILDYRCSNDRIDIYSLGCIIHFMLTGRSPKENTSQKTSISKKVRRIIDRCTASYWSRYKNVSQVQTDILHALNTRSSGGSNSGILPLIPGFRSRKRWKMALASTYYLMTLLPVLFVFLMYMAGVIDISYAIENLHYLCIYWGSVFVAFDVFHWGDHYRPYTILRNKIPVIRIPVKILAVCLFQFFYCLVFLY